MNSDAALRAQTDPFTLGNRAIFSALTAWAPLAAIVRAGNRTSTVPRADGIDAERAANVGKVKTSFPCFLVTQAGHQLMPDGRNSRTVDIRADYIVQWATDVLNVVPLNVCKWETLRAFAAATDNFGLGFVRGRQFRDAQEGAAIVIPGPGEQGTGGTAGWVTSGVISLEMCFSKTGLATWGSALSVTHYYSTAEGSNTFASILPPDLAPVMDDDGFAFNLPSPPDAGILATMGASAQSRGISATVDAEANLGCDYALWVSDNATCKAKMAEVAANLDLLRASGPDVPLYVFNQSGNLPSAGYEAFMAWEVGVFGPRIAGCTITAYWVTAGVPVNASHFTAMDAYLDFYRSVYAVYYRGKRIRLFASTDLYDGSGPPYAYVGDAAMQHLIDYAVAHDCDIEWWQASSTLPIHAEALTFLRSVLLV